METGISADDTAYTDRSLILRIFGVALLLGGGAAAFIGPLEMYAFYAFSEGGKFHYEGFGVGSFMFANIAGSASTDNAPAVL